MKNNNKTPKEENRALDPALIQMYYDHQYQRFDKHEEQRFLFTNIVLSISALVITFGYDDLSNFSAINGIGLPLIIILCNIFAMIYIRNSRDWTRTHKLRAKKILELYARELYKLDLTTPESYPIRKLGRWDIHFLLHVLFIIIFLVIIVTYVVIMIR